MMVVTFAGCCASALLALGTAAQSPQPPLQGGEDMKRMARPCFARGFLPVKSRGTPNF